MTAEPITYSRYTGVYRSDPAQVAFVRSALHELLSGHPREDDAILVASEFAANAVVHSSGDAFRVRCEIQPGYVRVRVEDLGRWIPQQQHHDDRPHGLDLVDELAGPGNWGISTTDDGRTVAWARLDYQEEEDMSTWGDAPQTTPGYQPEPVTATIYHRRQPVRWAQLAPYLAALIGVAIAGAALVLFLTWRYEVNAQVAMLRTEVAAVHAQLARATDNGQAQISGLTRTVGALRGDVGRLSAQAGRFPEVCAVDASGSSGVASYAVPCRP